MSLERIGYCGVDWVYVAQVWSQWRDFVNMVLNAQVPCSVGNFVTS
jgi:hypothetical protein